MNCIQMLKFLIVRMIIADKEENMLEKKFIKCYMESKIRTWFILCRSKYGDFRILENRCLDGTIHRLCVVNPIEIAYTYIG